VMLFSLEALKARSRRPCAGDSTSRLLAHLHPRAGVVSAVS
jgi:hypothetical protein